MKSFHEGSRRRWLLASAAASLLLAGGCDRQPAGAPSGNGSASGPVMQTAAPANPRSAILHASAEPFEGLTEQAFTAPWPQIDGLIAEGRTAAANARRVLPGARAAALDRQIATIAAARQAGDRPGLALASVETFRQLVEGQDAAAAQVPIPVSLLDYAGFRYDALAQAPKIDWAAMEQAARFAGRQWQAIAPMVTSKALPGVMTTSLGAMSLAAKRHDTAFARSAAATELALVDLIEEQVASQQAAPTR